MPKALTPEQSVAIVARQADERAVALFEENRIHFPHFTALQESLFVGMLAVAFLEGSQVTVNLMRENTPRVIHEAFRRALGDK